MCALSLQRVYTSKHAGKWMLSVILMKLSSILYRHQPVNDLLSSNEQAIVANNRKILGSIIDTIFLCGRQCLPLRGHRDDGVPLDREDGNNPGNFIELLKFRYVSLQNIYQRTAP